MKRLIALAFLMALAGCQANPEVSTDELLSIRVPMGYIPNVQYAPFYVAVEKGYFADVGIEIEFDYSFETNGIKLVGAGETPFAVVSGEQVLLARAQDIPIVYVTAWFQDYPVAVIAKTGSGIETPADLAGKKIGLPDLLGASYVGLRALLGHAGLTETDVTLDAIGFTQVQALAADIDQAVVGYFSNEPIQLRAEGYDVVEIRVADYVTLASNGLISSEDTIANDPELVRRFVGAFLRGLSDTIADPAAAYLISMGFVEGLAADDPVQMEVLTASIEFWRAERPGFSEAQAWENMQTVLLEIGQLTAPLELEAAYTNAFLP